MIVLVKANVLVIGLPGKIQSLEALPIRVIQTRNSKQAICSLKNEEIDGIISQWNLADSPNGNFIKTLRTARPQLPLVAVVDPEDITQEIAARSVGVTAVIANDSSEAYTQKVISQVLGIDVSTINIYAAADKV